MAVPAVWDVPTFVKNNKVRQMNVIVFMIEFFREFSIEMNGRKEKHRGTEDTEELIIVFL